MNFDEIPHHVARCPMVRRFSWAHGVVDMLTSTPAHELPSDAEFPVVGAGGGAEILKKALSRKRSAMQRK